MTVSANTQAILLLTAHFNKADSRGAKPLAPKEWGRFAEWLIQRSLWPEDLLRGSVTELLDGWHDKSVSLERVRALLDRGSALALSMEKWLRSGLWVMTRSDPDYPKRLKQRLGGDSPAVFFGCGDRALLNRGGLAVVGSRSVKEADLAYSKELGRFASAAGVSIVSGGARGVDETAMLGALEAEGTAVGVLADSLLRACTAAKYRKHLLEKNLALVSPFNPEAGFNVGNAMQRNKYIYCLADAALAVHSGKTGGTWTGAGEVLRNGWVPLWAKYNDDPESGNAALIAQGARQAPAGIGELDVMSLFGSASSRDDYTVHVGKPASAIAEGPRRLTDGDGSKVASDTMLGASKTAASAHGAEQLSGSDQKPASTAASVRDPCQVSFYDLFLDKAKELCRQEARTAKEMAEVLALNKSQVDVWLKQAVEDRMLEKATKSGRYQAVTNLRLPL